MIEQTNGFSLHMDIGRVSAQQNQGHTLCVPLRNSCREKNPGHETIEVVKQGSGDMYYTDDVFRGFWWSVPIPTLPSIPNCGP